MTSHLAEWSPVSDSTYNRLSRKCESILQSHAWLCLKLSLFPFPTLFLPLYLFVPFNSWSHSYASWISNAYLWSGLMSAACPDSMMDSAAILLPLHIPPLNPSVLHPDNPTSTAATCSITQTVGTGITHFSQVIIVLLLIQSPTTPPVSQLSTVYTKAKNPLDLREEQRQVSDGEFTWANSYRVTACHH